MLVTQYNYSYKWETK